jgi:hypothetical protein
MGEVYCRTIALAAVVSLLAKTYLKAAPVQAQYNICKKAAQADDCQGAERYEFDTDAACTPQYGGYSKIKRSFAHIQFVFHSIPLTSVYQNAHKDRII